MLPVPGGSELGTSQHLQSAAGKHHSREGGKEGRAPSSLLFHWRKAKGLVLRKAAVRGVHCILEQVFQ